MKEIKIDPNLNTLDEAVSKMITSQLEKDYPDGITYEDAVKYYSAHKEEAVVFEEPEYRSEMIALIKEKAPQAVVTGEEAIRRKEIQENYASDLWKAVLERELVRKVYKIPDRTLQAFLYPTLNPVENAKNKEYFEAYSLPEDSPERKAAMQKIMTDRMEEYGNINFDSYDIADESNFAEKYRSDFAMPRQCLNIENMRSTAMDFGVDFTSPRLEKFCRNAVVADSLLGAIGVQEKVLGNELYSEVDLNKLSVEEAAEVYEVFFDDDRIDSCSLMKPLTDMKGNLKAEFGGFFRGELTPAERVEYTRKFRPDMHDLNKNNQQARALERAQAKTMTPAQKAEFENRRVPTGDLSDNYFSECMEKHLNVLRNSFGYNNEFISAGGTDPDIKKGNFELFRQDGINSVSHILSAYQIKEEYTKKLKNGEITGETEAYVQFHSSLFEKRASELAKNPALKQVIDGMTQDDYNRLCSGSEAEIYDILHNKMPEAQRTLDEKAANEPAHDKEYFRNKVLANIEIIKTAVPDFQMSEEEIDAMVSDERIKMHLAAKEKIKDFAEKENIASNTIGSVPLELTRCISYKMDTSGTPEAQEKNREMLENFTAANQAGDNFRRQLYLDILNDANKLNPDDYIGEKSEKQLFDMALRDYENGKLGWGCVDIGNNKTNLTGFSLNSEKMESFKEQIPALTGLGPAVSVIVENMSNEDYFTVPFDKLSEEQSIMLGTVGTPEAMNMFSKAMLYQQNEKDLAELSSERELFGKTYSEKDLENFVPDRTRVLDDVGELGKTVNGIYTELKKASSVFSRTDSMEYRELLESLEKADKTLNGVSGPVSEEKAQKIYECMTDIKLKSNEYVRKKQNDPKNATRRKRIELSKEALALSSRLVSHNVKNAYRDGNFANFISCSDRKYMREKGLNPEEYYADVRKASSKTEVSPEEAEIRSMEELFEKGLRKTDEISRRAAEAPENSKEKMLYEQLAEARNELANQVGRQGDAFNKTKVLGCMGTIICCQTMLKSNPGVEITRSMLNSAVKSVCLDPKLQKAAADMDSGKVNEFLGSEEAENRFINGYTNAVKKEKTAEEPSLGGSKPELQENKVKSSAAPQSLI